MSLRDERQKEFANAWLDHGKFGILNLCPRFGKIYTTINALEQLPPHSTILIAYPDLKIEEAWEEDFARRGYSNPNITYTTHLSLHKYKEYDFDVIIIDEIHLLSEAQIEAAKELIEHNECVLGLTGTLSKWTEDTLNQELGLFVVAEYTIEQAVEEGVITDYEITIVKVPLDNRVKNKYKSKHRTEEQQFDAYSYVIRGMEQTGQNSMYLRLARMRLIQNSLAKLNKTKELLAKHANERVLVFCGVTDVADKLGIPSYHSKSSEKQLFEQFAGGKGNHLAVVKIGNTGVTYRPLNRVIINYFDSNAENLAQKINRCMAMEYDTPDKKAHIYIISSNEEVENKWLNKALEFFDKRKIRYESN